MPCTLTVTIPGGKSQTVTAIHKGNHDSYPRPPEHKPSPAAMKALTKIVKTNPEAGPAKLTMGTRDRPSVASSSKAFHNIDRLGHKRKQIVHNNLRAFGIRGSIGGLFEMSADFPTCFVVECSFKDGIISLQSDHMRQVLNDAAGGLQPDTVEGVINEAEHAKGSLNIHLASAFDLHQDRWVPVPMWITFGSKADFAQIMWWNQNSGRIWRHLPWHNNWLVQCSGQSHLKDTVRVCKKEIGKGAAWQRDLLLCQETWCSFQVVSRKGCLQQRSGSRGKRKGVSWTGKDNDSWGHHSQRILQSCWNID